MQTDVKRLRPLGDIVLTRVKFILTKFFFLEFAIIVSRTSKYRIVPLYYTNHNLSIFNFILVTLG